MVSLKDATGNVYGDTEHAKRKAIERTFKELEKQGEGAYGLFIHTNSDSNGGHYRAYRIINGKVHLLDGQSSNQDNWDWDMEEFGKQKGPYCKTNYQWFRLDNTEADPELLKELVEDRQRK